MEARIHLPLAAALAAAVALAPPPAPAAQGRKVFRRALSMVTSMDPLRAGDTAASAAVSMEYEPILDIDYYARPYRLKPSVCELPEVSADGLVYSFKVIEGVRFRNGSQVTAADVGTPAPGCG